ncbi:M48 family metalloprotease [Reichenbachiella versicolor]|uniref:M48 family metalloprotease n=1 Tax=Reichenbachiella versicolor TaxID=1821036 RepID=UPI000D6E70CF|nr:M48 family metalloprotease [Reichenbachiella versicolor]
MKIIKSLLFTLVLSTISIGLFTSCEDGVVLFSIEDDKQLGAQTAAQIASDPEQFPILPRQGNEAAYSYLQNMTDQILNSGEVKYRNEFVWKLHIIDQDVLNAFATPGGYIYVYTGLIKYLNTVDDLAGVMGHEIAHSDNRHSSKALQRQYGVQILLSILLGNDPGTLAQIAGSLAGTIDGLKFSQKNEADADDQSVIYLSSTDYACNGAATFFEQLLADGSVSSGPSFLSTHPSPDNRVADINSKATDIGCSVSQSNDNTDNMTYAEFQALFD